MRQFIQHRLKHAVQGSGQPNVATRGMYVKNLITGSLSEGGWTDGLDCSGGGTIGIRATADNSPLTWTDATGITITKNGTILATSVTINIGSVSPSNTVEFDVTWDQPISRYDTIAFHYDGALGNFSNANGPVETQTISLTNCIDAGPIVFQATAITVDLVTSNTITGIGGVIGVDWGDGNTIDYLGTATGVALGEITIKSADITSLQFTTDTFTSVHFINAGTITSASSMFNGNTNLTEFTSEFDTAGNIVNDYTSAFEGCTGLASSGIVNSTVGTIFNRMYANCTNLVCLTSIDTTNQTSTTDMFLNTPALAAPDGTEQTAILAGSSYVNPGDCPNIIAATGGTVTDVNGFRYHTFNVNGTFDVTSGGDMEYLIVSGGGGGGNSTNSSVRGGGGGAGGYLAIAAAAINIGSYQVVTGAGGNVDQDGTDSSFNTTTPTGGGRGGNNFGGSIGSGGSGGGAGGQNVAGGTGIAGQGFDGGYGHGDAGGGGGGAGSPGLLTTSGAGGIGTAGDGLQWLDGNFYAGGGGGSTATGPGGVGGSGVGGNGTGTSASTPAVANTGSGGGGGDTKGAATAGATGVVIIRYPI